MVQFLIQDAHHFDVNSLELPRNMSQYTRLGDIPNHVTSMKWHHVVDLVSQFVYIHNYIYTGELGYDGPLYDGFLHMTDYMLGPSLMHIQY